MKKYILLFLLVVVGLSSEVYGQKPRKFPKGYEFEPVLPTRDTVIMRGEEILVGGFLCEVNTKEFEIIGYGIAKKSDYKKGYYFIKLKPKQTTTYEFKWVEPYGVMNIGRNVYVAKTAEEKKQLEEGLKAKLSPYQRTTYHWENPKFKSNIKISGHSTRSLK